MLVLVAAVFAMHWDDISAGVIQSTVMESAVIVAVGLALAMRSALRAARLLVRGDRIESANGLTGRADAVHTVDDIELYYVYRKTSGGWGRAQGAPWMVRVAYRDGQHDDVHATSRNMKRLVAYLADRRVLRVNTPPADDEQSTTDWARTTERTGTGARIVVKVCAIILTIVASAGTLYFAQQLRVMGRSPSWPTVQGRVTFSTVRSNGRSTPSTVYTPTVRYTYRVGGRAFEGTHVAFGVYRTTDAELAHEVSAHYAAGTTVMVHYDPERPSDAVLQLKPDRMRWSKLMLSVCILCFGLFGVFARLPRYREAPV